MDKFLVRRSSSAPSSSPKPSVAKDAGAKRRPGPGDHAAAAAAAATPSAKRSRSGQAATRVSGIGLSGSNGGIGNRNKSGNFSQESRSLRRSSTDPGGILPLRDRGVNGLSSMGHERRQRSHGLSSKFGRTRGQPTAKTRDEAGGLSAIALARAAATDREASKRWGIVADNSGPASNCKIKWENQAKTRSIDARRVSPLQELMRSSSSEPGQRRRRLGDFMANKRNAPTPVPSVDESGEGRPLVPTVATDSQAAMATAATVRHSTELPTVPASAGDSSSSSSSSSSGGFHSTTGRGHSDGDRGPPPRILGPGQSFAVRRDQPESSTTPSGSSQEAEEKPVVEQATNSADISQIAGPTVAAPRPALRVALRNTTRHPDRMTSYFPRANVGRVAPARRPCRGRATFGGADPRFKDCLEESGAEEDEDASDEENDEGRIDVGDYDSDLMDLLSNDPSESVSREASREPCRPIERSITSADSRRAEKGEYDPNSTVKGTTIRSTRHEQHQRSMEWSTTEGTRLTESMLTSNSDGANSAQRPASLLAAEAAERRAREASALSTDKNTLVLPATSSSKPVAGDMELATEDESATAAVAGDVAMDEIVADFEAETEQVSQAVATTFGAAGAAEILDDSEQLAEERERKRRARLPGRRRGGMAALFLAQRHSTGFRHGLDCGGGFTVDSGKEAFRRRALSRLFNAGLTQIKLRMGRVVGSQTGSGVVRGQPLPPGRDGGGHWRGNVPGTSALVGVLCLEFDAFGALLAAGGADNVSVYEFDEFLPKIHRVPPSTATSSRCYLQPRFCIHTGRAVSSVRWNPADENQLAVSFLHYDEIQLFDLGLVLPDTEAIPIATLVPDGARGMAGRNNRPAVGAGSDVTSRRATSGSIRGLGHSCLEFVMRGGADGRSSRVAHVVAGGRGGVFRAWRLTSNGEISPYLQVLPGSTPRGGGAFTGWLKPRADITAVCCISSDVAVLGTDEGVVVTMSLHPTPVKAFGSGKSAERLGQWSLLDPDIWGHTGLASALHGSSSSAIDLSTLSPRDLRIRFIKPSSGHTRGVVVCGLLSGRAIVFDTRAGRALGITAPGAAPPSGLFCQPGAGGAWGDGLISCPVVNDAGNKELMFLATSARAGLEARRKGGRDASMRPGPGWALGETGGGGFRVVESSGYDFCLPMTIKRATPGQSAITLTADARGYLCPRAEVRLLNTCLVTSSVVIAGEEHSVEAMGADGMTLVLDRRYQGPVVREDGDEEQGLAGSGDGNLEESNRSEPRRESSASVPHQEASERTAAIEGASMPGPAAEEGGASPVGEEPRILARGQSEAAEQGTRNVDTPSPDESKCCSELSSHRVWDRSWCPAGSVKLFAKLKAVFNYEEQSLQSAVLSRVSAAKRLGVNSWEKATLIAAGGAESDDDIVGSDADVSDTATPTKPWAALQVVARAPLSDLPVTAITCHPDMNFVLLGLEDGTISTVLPGRRTKRAIRTKPKSKKRQMQEAHGLFPSLWNRK